MPCVPFFLRAVITHGIRSVCWVCTATLLLSGCFSREGDLTLTCQGTKHVIHGKSDAPRSIGTREADVSRTYSFTGKKFKGEHACQIWTADAIRCETAMPDGSFYQLIKVDRRKQALKDQVYRNEHAAVDETLFDATCDEVHP
jgi:hypothetical protein